MMPDLTAKRLQLLKGDGAASYPRLILLDRFEIAGVINHSTSSASLSHHDFGEERV